MSHLHPNTIKLTTVAKQINYAFMRPLQKQYLHDNVFASITISEQAGDNRITVIPAGTNAGKSTVITLITIPHIIQRNSSVKCIVFTSPDSGCVDGPYHKFYAEWNGKKIQCADGTIKTIRARRKDEIKKSWEINESSSATIVDVWFVSTQWLRSVWIDYDEPSKPKSIGVPDFIIVDEIHFGMGTIDGSTIMEDQGRNNKNYDPKWLPTIYGMSLAGSRVLGYTGTATKSQQGKTILGATVFKSLTPMPENKNTSVFAEVLPIKTEVYSSTYRSELLNTYDLSKTVYELSVDKCDKFFREIDEDTWQKAMDIGIVQVMPGTFFKFGREDASKAIPLYSSRGRRNDFMTFGGDINADIGIVTSDEKKYLKPKVGREYKDAYSIVRNANDSDNIVNPFLLGVIMQGNMGWDIPRLKQISFLGYPSAKNVFLMQLQTMARAKRLLCSVYDHTDKAREIAELDVSTEQKILLAKFVVFVNTVNIVIPNDAPLLDSAYSEFRQNMHTPNEGLDLYLNIIATHMPVKKKSNVSKFVKPHFHMGYNPGSQNQANKKDYCEHCTNLGLVNDKGVALCKVLGRALADDLSNDLTGVNLTDEEFEHHWKGSLKLDHLNSVRTDNRPENLFTRCGISDALKTLLNKDYLGKYDDNGNKVSNG
jgi:hypothetical protein